MFELLVLYFILKVTKVIFKYCEGLVHLMVDVAMVLFGLSLKLKGWLRFRCLLIFDIC